MHRLPFQMLTLVIHASLLLGYTTPLYGDHETKGIQWAIAESIGTNESEEQLNPIEVKHKSNFNYTTIPYTTANPTVLISENETTTLPSIEKPLIKKKANRSRSGSKKRTKSTLKNSEETDGISEELSLTTESVIVSQKTDETYLSDSSSENTSIMNIIEPSFQYDKKLRLSKSKYNSFDENIEKEFLKPRKSDSFKKSAKANNSNALVTNIFSSINISLDCLDLCPKYKLLENRSGYEVRLYPPSRWLSSTIISNNRILAEFKALDTLQKYFNGDNEKGLNFSKTTPVITQMKLHEHPRSKEIVNEYTLSFYLKTDGSTDPPAPNDSETLIDTMEERTVYSRPFSAMLWDMTDGFLQSQARRLAATLRQDGEPFLSKYFYVASYSSEMSHTVGQYEIWMYATRFRPAVVTKLSSQLHEERLTDVTKKTRLNVCKGIECPKFEVIATYRAGIQKRRYYGTKFATYYPNSCDFTKAGIWRAFMPLHLYKHGVNSHFEVIGHTRPAGVVHVKEAEPLDANFTCTQTYTVSLYLPRRLHAAPPVSGPGAPQIQITDFDDVIVFVQAVGGFLLVEERIRKEVDMFHNRLQELGLCHKSDEYYLVVYDSVTRFHGRLNEIWMVADRCQDVL